MVIGSGQDCLLAEEEVQQKPIRGCGLRTRRHSNEPGGRRAVRDGAGVQRVAAVIV